MLAYENMDEAQALLNANVWALKKKRIIRFSTSSLAN
jgi:hypothetical protein